MKTNELFWNIKYYGIDPGYIFYMQFREESVWKCRRVERSHVLFNIDMGTGHVVVTASW